MTIRLIALSALFLFASCQGERTQTKKNETPNPHYAISERGQQVDKQILLIQLSEKPLLEVQFETNSMGKIDRFQKIKILKEQNQFIQNLNNISSEIKVIYRYQKVINGLAIVVPNEFESQVQQLSGIGHMEREGLFAAVSSVGKDLEPYEKVGEDDDSTTPTLGQKNSASFIGALKAHQLGFSGEKISIGVIDTGIDYIHTMMGGPGTEEAYKELKLNESNANFPNQKVVGGIDLVGEKYDPSSPVFSKRIPIPDDNPMDEGGHGTHVAGSVAGLGDNINTYNGVAPKADLYAIKVFGAGSVGDAVVVKALEYAADPNGDFNLSDQLDVVNLSLGSSYGGLHLIYRKAIRNLARAGTVVVASAGNSGHFSYITGAPGSINEAISVAASVDDMDHNIKSLATTFETTSRPSFKAPSLEGSFSKKLADAGDISGSIVFAGLADVDFDQTLKDSLKGKIALIQRGGVSFFDKVKRAFDAGALATIVFNNKPGAPFVMGGGDTTIDIPAIMISLEAGDFLKTELEAGDVIANLSKDDFILNLALVDTLTSFSSQGPRLGDSLLKPEISAPGFNIISAALASGNKGNRKSGTSMSAPHIAGVMGLIKQKAIEFETSLGRHLTNEEFKSLLMNSAKRISRDTKTEYPVSQQGAGRVQILKSINTKVMATPSSLSLGQHFIADSITMQKQLSVTNLDSTMAQDFSFKVDAHPAISLHNVQDISINPLETISFNIDIEVDPNQMDSYHNEIDGFIQVIANEEVVASIPLLMVASRVSGLELTSTKTTTGSFETVITNFNEQAGEALLFNLLGEDDKVTQTVLVDAGSEKGCDLKSAGYRITSNEEAKKFVEIAYELHDSRNSFQPCELIVLIDSDEDNIVDFELVGAMGDNMGLKSKEFSSMLFDAKEVRKLRRKYEQSHFNNSPVKQRSPEYASALKAQEVMQVFKNSSLAVLRMPLEPILGESEAKNLNIKVLIDRTNASNSERDDYLANHKNTWVSLGLDANSLPLSSMVDSSISFGDTKLVKASRGNGSNGKFVLYLPSNAPIARSIIGEIK